MMDGQLGCGEYSVQIRARGGGTLVARVPWTTIEWTRMLDETSAATVEVAVGAGCSEALCNVRPWRHELMILRDGFSVWEGPVYAPVAPVERLRIDARDLSAWWDRRRLHNDHDLQNVDLATIFQAFSDDAMAPDNSPGLFVTTTPCGVLGTQTVVATQHQIAGSLIRDISNTGIDWTVVKRQVLAGGLVVPTTSLGTLRDDHFIEPPEASADGSVQVNSWIVSGAGGGAAGDDIFGSASDAASIALDGLLEAVDSVSTIQNQAAADAAAASRVALTKDVIGIEEAHLSPEAPFPIAVLVPGALCDLMLRRSCLPVTGSHRLQEVRVNIDDRGFEDVSLAFQPPGTIE